MPRYLSQAEIIEAFGDPIPYVLESGMISPRWEARILRSMELLDPIALAWLPGVMVKKVRCHFLVLPFLKAAFDEIQGNEELAPMLVDFGGCYEWRRQRGTAVISRHSWGLGPDVNVNENPQGKQPTPNMHLIAAIFEKHGFYWGGRFKGRRVDGMHFEFGDLERLQTS